MVFGSSQAALAHLMKYFVDGLQSRDAEYLALVPLGLMGIALVRGIAFFAGNYLVAKVAMNIVHQIRCEVFDHLMLAPKTYYDKSNVGEIISILVYNVSQVSGAATDGIKVIVREGFTIFWLIIYLFWMNWQLSSVFLLVTPVIAVLVYFVGKRLKAITRRMQSSMGGITHVAKETLSSVHVVRAFGGQAHERNRFRVASEEATKTSLKLTRTTAAASPTMQFLVSIALAALMYSVLRFFQDQSAGDVIAYITAAGLLPKPLRVLSDVWGMLQRGLVAAESVFETLDSEKEKDQGTIESIRTKGKVDADNLVFTYDSANTPAIKGISFHIEPGNMVALVGHSGSGKTTITNLLLRFYDYQSGSLKIDEFDVKDFKLATLRDQFSLVTQHVELFNDSVRNNVAYGSETHYSDDQIWAALESANAKEFVLKLDHGLDSLVGENGAKLSGGQRQRLAIARAILKDAPILILDEATSALDSQSEQQIQKALDNVTKNRTTIVVAHRLSTILKADNILVFQEGEIRESGTHSDLVQKGGIYSNLYNTQFQDS